MGDAEAPADVTHESSASVAWYSFLRLSVLRKDAVRVFFKKIVCVCVPIPALRHAALVYYSDYNMA